MVSSDFGKLDVMRHLISGEDCAIAGEATAATAAPVADTFKKSRRFIEGISLLGRFPYFLEQFSRRWRFSVSRRRSGGRSLTRIFGPRIADEGMTALIKRKSHMGKKPLKPRQSRPGAGRGPW